MPLLNARICQTSAWSMYICGSDFSHVTKQLCTCYTNEDLVEIKNLVTTEETNWELRIGEKTRRQTKEEEPWSPDMHAGTQAHSHWSAWSDRILEEGCLWLEDGAFGWSVHFGIRSTLKNSTEMMTRVQWTNHSNQMRNIFPLTLVL